jgi:SAM-dependent methyltransferase
MSRTFTSRTPSPGGIHQVSVSSGIPILARFVPGLPGCSVFTTPGMRNASGTRAPAPRAHGSRLIPCGMRAPEARARGLAPRPAAPGPPSREAHPEFPAERLFRLRRLETWHFWFRGRLQLLERLLERHARRPERVLDVGSGTGHMIGHLLRRAPAVIGLDRRPEGLQETRTALPRARVVQGDAMALPFGSEMFDLVTLLDVLEHVDDHRLLDEVRRVLTPRGIALITVPAMPWLWSHRDTAAGHRRRYTRKTLAAVVGARGLELRELRYYQCLLFPLVLMTRLLGKRMSVAAEVEERVPALLNGVFTRINQIEIRLGDAISWPWGSTLVAVCRRT